MIKSVFATTFAGCIALLVVVAMSVGVHADGPPPEVQRAAEEGLAHFLSTVPAEELARMGLETAEDVGAATLGAPYEQFTLTSGALSTYESGASLLSLLTSTGAWLFPVVVGGEARTMLTVSKVDDQWAAGDIGGTHLPAALQAAEANLPALLEQKGITSAYTARFVRVFQVYADFLAVEAGDAEYLLPLMADPSQFGLEADSLATPDQVLGQLDALMGPAPEGEAMGGGGEEAVEEGGTESGGGAETASEAGGVVDLPPVEEEGAQPGGEAEAASEAGGAADVPPVEAETDAAQDRTTSGFPLCGGASALALTVLSGALAMVVRKGRV